MSSKSSKPWRGRPHFYHIADEFIEDSQSGVCASTDPPRDRLAISLGDLRVNLTIRPTTWDAAPQARQPSTPPPPKSWVEATAPGTQRLLWADTTDSASDQGYEEEGAAPEDHLGTADGQPEDDLDCQMTEDDDYADLDATTSLPQAQSSTAMTSPVIYSNDLTMGTTQHRTPKAQKGAQTTTSIPL